MTRRSLPMVAAGLIVIVSGFSPAPASAHHGFAATYLPDKTVMIAGTVVEFRFLNPHSYVTVDCREPSGAPVRWTVEWGAGLQLDRRGVTRESLKPADYVIVRGNPARDPDVHRVRMVTIVRPSDGWHWDGTFD